MEQMTSKSVSWGDNDLLESTSDPNMSVTSVAEELPTLTVATIVAVTIVVLFAIVAVFLLGVLIDCRQQRVLAEKMDEVKRFKQQRRANVNTHPDDDSTVIVNDVEEVGMSEPPASSLRDIP